jgi:diguanylate cyclase
MAATLAARATDILLLHRRRVEVAWDGRSELRRFAAGVVITSVLRVAFPLCFFGRLTEFGRTATVMVLCGMASGGVTVLAAARRLAFFFLALTLLPTATLFLLTRGFEHQLLGLLGWIFFGVLVMSTRVANHSGMDAMRLNRELISAQNTLREMNQSLEATVRLRTAELRREVREREGYARKLAHLASTDDLTGLHNRSALVERLGNTICRNPPHSAVAVLFIDLDKFKQVNDVMGHIAGDQVLVSVARRLSGCLPQGTDLARWGGDEFVAVLSGVQSVATAVEAADRLRASLAKPIQVDIDRVQPEFVKIDATIGIALYPRDGTSHDELIRASDMAMYSGKEGNVKVRVFDQALACRVAERHQSAQNLRDASETGALRLVFQPVVRTSNGQCNAMEALLR